MFSTILPGTADRSQVSQHQTMNLFHEIVDNHPQTVLYKFLWTHYHCNKTVESMNCVNVARADLFLWFHALNQR